MTTIKWGLAIVIAIIYSVLFVNYCIESDKITKEKEVETCGQRIEDMCDQHQVQVNYKIMKGVERGKLIEKMVLVTVFGTSFLLALRIVEENKEKPKRSSIFFYLHIVQMAILALLAWHTLLNRMDYFIGIVLFFVLLIALILYSFILHKVLHSDKYPSHLWTIESMLFYIALVLYAFLSRNYVSEMVFRILESDIYIYLIILHMFTWIVKLKFVKIGTFLQGMLLSFMLLIGLLWILWFFAFQNLM